MVTDKTYFTAEDAESAEGGGDSLLVPCVLRVLCGDVFV
jgi:hypothetical protein